MLRGREHLLQLLLTRKFQMDGTISVMEWKRISWEDFLCIHVCCYSQPSDRSLSPWPLYSVLELAPLTRHGNTLFRWRIRKIHAFGVEIRTTLKSVYSFKWTHGLPFLCPDTKGGSQWWAQPGHPWWSKDCFMYYENWSHQLCCHLQGAKPAVRKTWRHILGLGYHWRGRHSPWQTWLQPPPSEQPVLPKDRACAHSNGSVTSQLLQGASGINFPVPVSWLHCEELLWICSPVIYNTDVIPNAAWDLGEFIVKGTGTSRAGSLGLTRWEMLPKCTE